MAKSIWNDAPHHMSSGKCKLKQQGTTTHLVEWPKSGTLATPSTDRDVERQDSPHCWRKGKMAPYLGRQFGSFLQNETYSYHRIQLSGSSILTQKM